MSSDDSKPIRWGFGKKLPSDDPLDCKVCDTIWGYFSNDNKPRLNLGSFEDVLSSGCPRHTPLISSFRDYCRSKSGSYPKDVSGNIHMWGYRQVLNLLHLTLGVSWNLTLVEKNGELGHVGTGRLLDRKLCFSRVASPNPVES